MFEGIKKAFKSFVDKVARRRLSEDEINEILEELELKLLENDVAYEVCEALIEKTKEKILELRDELTKEQGRDLILKVLRDVVLDMLREEQRDFMKAFEELVRSKKPVVVMFVGVNGVGKTTTIAKIAHLLKKRGYKVVLACSDTHRAGAEEQLEKFASMLGLRMIKHPYGSDPAAVAFDAINYAKANDLDCVLIDTAGRMHSRKNLMEELRKIARVGEPDLVVFVGDSLTGNDAVNQAAEFSRYLRVDGVVLTKMDADAKGGAVLSVKYALNKPIYFVGVGQGLDDLVAFDAKWYVEHVLGSGEGEK